MVHAVMQYCTNLAKPAGWTQDKPWMRRQVAHLRCRRLTEEMSKCGVPFSRWWRGFFGRLYPSEHR